MNWDQVKGNWKQFKGKVKEKWGKLTDDDLTTAAGRRDRLRAVDREGNCRAAGWTPDRFEPSRPHDLRDDRAEAVPERRQFLATAAVITIGNVRYPSPSWCFPYKPFCKLLFP